MLRLPPNEMGRALIRRLALLLIASGTFACANHSAAPKPLPGVLVIAHRGASALMPEHTIAAYAKAIDLGADAIEPDLVISKDGVLIARHENEIGRTTDVAGKPEFAARKTVKVIDGASVSGWFTEDFTLKELKTLRAVERIPANRPGNTRFNGQFEIPTLQEIIDLAKARTESSRRTIAVYPETKHPSYFRSVGLPLETRLADQLKANGYFDKNAAVFIQSFEVGSLKELRAMTPVRLVQLIGNPKAQPEDFRLAGDARTYSDLITPAGLRAIASYANGIGPAKELLVPRDAQGNLGAASPLGADAKAAGLLVHPYTFRPENPFLPRNLRRGDVQSPSERGDLAAEIAVFLQAGVDGIFADDPAIARQAVDRFLATK